MRFLKWVALAIAILAISSFAGWRYVIDWRPSPARFPVQGVDVSHHQGAIDWVAVRRAGASFAYIKATEGGDHRDSRFEANWIDAHEAGLRRGAYHFFTLCRPGADQARNFIATTPADADALAPVVDLEFVGNCAARPSRDALLRELAIFLERIEAHAGQRAILYVIEDFDRHYRVTEAFDRPLWLRGLFRQPDYGAPPWTIWQASAFRRMPGIEGGVDWNVMRP